MRDGYSNEFEGLNNLGFNSVRIKEDIDIVSK